MHEREPFTLGYLHTQGSRIVDASGAEVGLSGVNWFGFETANAAPHGLWSRDWEDVLDQIRDLGYNTIRLPFSNAMLESNAALTGIDELKNPDLVGLAPIEVMDKIIAGAGERGMWVILDNHRSTPGGGPEGDGLWYTPDYPESRWIQDWEMLAARYAGNPAVVGADLRNEPHGACWGCGDPQKDWRLAAERAGNAILAVNPHLLILVEGVATYQGQSTWWGGNLLGAKDYPVRLDVPGRLVYSPHEYPSSLFPHPWFQDPAYPRNLPQVWDGFWGYLVNEDIAPVLIGEFGSRLTSASDRKWLQSLQEYIRAKRLSWTFWSLNPNSGDTGGLLLDDWQSVNREKQALLKKIQYPQAGPVQTQATPPPNRTTPGNEEPQNTPGVQKTPAPQGNTPTLQSTPRPRVGSQRKTLSQDFKNRDPDPQIPANVPLKSAKTNKPYPLGSFEDNSLQAWSPFSDGLSTVTILRSALAKTGRQALRVEYSISPAGWGGIESKFNLAQDWQSYSKVAFSLCGQNSGNLLRIELLGRRQDSDLSKDSAVRFEVVIRDDFIGWKEFSLPWSAFRLRADWQPVAVGSAVFDPGEVWGLNFAAVNGRGWFQVDHLRLSR